MCDPTVQEYNVELPLLVVAAKDDGRRQLEKELKFTVWKLDAFLAVSGSWLFWPQIFPLPTEADELWFKQRLTHFNANITTTWKQRYFVNDDFYKNNDAPVFVLIGGEGEASKNEMYEGAWLYYAHYFGALCIQLEHRYYGKSRPTSDLSTKNLRYLNSRQALADLASFVSAMKIKYNLTETQKWIAFGGSYPGSLAAWARVKYPHLIHGAISSSGPLLAQVDFKEYLEVVKSTLASYKPACLDAVTRSFADLENSIFSKLKDQRAVDRIFKTCTPIEKSVENQLDISSLFESIASNFAGVVQYNKDNGITIDQICDIMLNTTAGSPLRRLGFVHDMLLEQANTNCRKYKYDSLIADMKNISWDSEVANGRRQWNYQSCHEFGFFQTADNNTFGNRFGVDFFIRQCMDIYSKKMNSKYLKRAVKKTNLYYGALKPNTTNVLYVHGSIDPWRMLGVFNSTSKRTPNIYIEGTAHCTDVYAPMETDPPQLVIAREMIVKYLAKILKYKPRIMP